MDKKPDYTVKNKHSEKVYDVFNASKTASSLWGDFHMHGSNIIVFGLFLLCDIDFL